MNTMQAEYEKYTLGEMAERLDCSKSYVSRKARQGGDAKGFPVGEYAVTDGTGKLSHFNVPADAFEEQADDPDDAREDGDTVTAKARVQSIRDVARAGRERAEQRRNARAKERDAHTYSVAEMAQILDTDAQKVHDAVANGRDVRGFPVNDFAVTDETGGLEGFRVPNSAFDDAESSRETGEARENASVTVEVNTDAAADQSDEQEEEKEEQEPERQRQPMPNRNGRSAPSLLSSFAALGGAVTLLGLFGSSDKN